MGLPAVPPLPRPRLCFLGYRHLAAMAGPIIAEYAGRADIEVIEEAFDAALAIARARIRSNAVDVFVSAGANGAILRANLQSAPVALIQLEGFDVMQALLKARDKARRVGVIMYGRIIPELDDVKDLLKIDIAQYAYHTPDEVQRRVEQLKADGFSVIVGSSLVVEMAERCGLTGLLAYSLRGIRRGLDDALDIAHVRRLEIGRYEQLNSVLGNLQEAVLAVDRQHRIIATNARMQTLLGRAGTMLLGQSLDTVEPELSLTSTMDTGIEERAVVQRFGRRDWIVNRTPVREHGVITGAAMTLVDARVITEADTNLRIQQRKRQAATRYSFDDLLGQSTVFMRAVAMARRFAQTDLTVLVFGESGTGKEMFAQAIHNDSRRAGKPFVALNCAAFPEQLLESELFGHEEGAFTGARHGGKRGLFEAAHTGTLFLDEIGDMPLALQTRLLRVLQEREIVRVGGTTTIPVDVRIIAATHQPLQELIAQRRFRQDLYYRINTLRLPLPPLRERRTDIPLLARRLVERALKSMRHDLDVDRVLAPLLPALCAYAWPGNVRELDNVAERISAFLLQFSSEDEISFDGFYEESPELALPHALHATPGADGDAHTQRQRAEQALARCHGNRTAAAGQLGISRSTLWRWLQTPAQ
ncbi:MAG TPA: propionate catabolism operon regulatory protein PrpR [Herbaspirillum sp.]|uniref:propionate catabolism operon regulatory protein PrpR n=1 Tax=Herbaspirillum sp. TaxID=1890675 RepID=UPI002D6C2341|nr:propionate catabolism operon regulatory protein PrpR [Herbaspirillum sp.]HZG18861.1 propionate catabolism operon regulatory protein PrpR [Herbaspirillum sp.]